MRVSKDTSVLREGDSVQKQATGNRGFLKDYSMKHTVEVMWDLSEESKLDRMFKLRIDDKEVILDYEEFFRNIRWV